MMLLDPAERPPAVTAAIDAKYGLLSSSAEQRGTEATAVTTPAPVCSAWVNMGETGAARVYLSRSGHFTTAGEVLRAALMYEGRNCLAEASCGRPSPRLLDLGTAEGRLLVHAYEGDYHLSWNDIVGVSALDHRPSRPPSPPSPSTTTTTIIPDGSYRVFNIDRLHEHLADLKSGGGRYGARRTFRMIWSSATLYHLVDPIGAVLTAYGLLDPGGLLLLRHLPLAAQTRGTISAAAFTRLLAAAGVAECCAWDMPDKPGLAALCLRRPLTALTAPAAPAASLATQAPSRLDLPLAYSGEVVRMGGPAGYQYAALHDAAAAEQLLVGTHARSATDGAGPATLSSGDDEEQEGGNDNDNEAVVRFFASLSIPVHDPEPVSPPAAPPPTRCRVC